MTKILIPWVLRAGAAIIPAAAILLLVVAGSEHAIGVLVGGVLSLADGLGIVYLAGALLEPGSKKSKPLLFAILFGKFALVALLLWAALSMWGVSGLGLVVGIGSGLMALVVGVNRGSSSAEGKKAMEEAEERMRAEFEANESEDKDADSR